MGIEIAEQTAEAVVVEGLRVGRAFAEEFGEAFDPEDPSDIEWAGTAWEEVKGDLRLASDPELTAEALCWLDVERFRPAIQRGSEEG